MTRKDFLLIGNMIEAMQPLTAAQIDAAIAVLQRSNPNFNRDRFVAYLETIKSK